jgi:hypothetical protein
MAHDAHLIREAIDALIAELMAQMQSVNPRDKAFFQKTLVDHRACVLECLRSGKLTAADWPSIEAEFRLFVYTYLTPSTVLLERAAFSEQLKNRQGTRIPDWRQFYSDRAELERRIGERKDELDSPRETGEDIS